MAPPQLRPASVARTAEGTPTLGNLDLPAIFLRTTYFNPLTRRDTPLPRHQWLLRSTSPGDGIRVGWSDEEGVTDLRPLREDHDPAASWEIVWFPLTAEGPLPLGGARDAFLDLEKNAWVPVDEVGAIEKRRLLRLWPWSSVEKVKAGGFFQSLTDGFAWTGVVHGGELTRVRLAFGRRATALAVKVDHLFFHSRVKFLFYDLSARKTATVPPGLVLSAFDERGARVGAGTALSDDGTIYVLHQRTVEQSPGLHYGFETPARYTLVDLTATPPAVVFQPAPPPQVATRYLLPERWHSKGWQVQLTARTAWDLARDVRTAPTDVDPLQFHLDDTVLVTSEREIEEIAPQTDLTVFNQLLVIRDARSSRPHVSGAEIWFNYLPAEDRVVREGQGLHELTRLFDCDGKLYDLREERRAGTPGETALVGARVAVHDDRPWLDFSRGDYTLLGQGTFTLHLVDTHVDDFMYPSALTGAPVAGRLHHLVPYSSAYVDQGNATPADVDAVLALLDWCASAWNAGHPSASLLNQGKRYALVPEDGLQAGQAIVLVRHFFGHRRRPAPRKLTIELDVKNGRAVTRDDRIVISPAVAVTNAMVTDPDGVLVQEMPLAHEIGHSLSLFDDYLELNEQGAPLPRFEQSAFGQSDRFRPFEHDRRSMMHSNYLPRLRYYWHFVRALNNEAALSGPLGYRRFVAEHRTWPYGPLVYRLPELRPGILAVPENHGPWQAIGEADLEPGHASLGLYRLGADESAAGGIFSGLGMFVPLIPPADGALVIQIRIAFSPAPGKFFFDAFEAALALHWRLVGPWGEHLHHLVLARSPSSLTRIALIFQALYHTEPQAPALPPHVRVNIVPESSAAPNSLLLAEKDRPPVLSMRPSEVGLAIVRHALGLPTSSPVPGGAPVLLNEPLTAGELQGSGLIRAVDAMLEESGGATTVVPL